MCKYSSYHYWEKALLNEKELWQGYFEDLDSAQDAIFINTVIIDYDRNMLDNNWACYPDVKSLLGFLQFIYIPLAFFYTIHPDSDNLYIPMCASSTLIQDIRDSGSKYGTVMEAAIQELNSYWALDNALCLQKIVDFCRRFNAFWSHEHYILNIGVFNNTFEIARYLVGTTEFSEVLEEDMGLTTKQLFQLCRKFYHDKFTQKNFIKILNHKIGCVI